MSENFAAIIARYISLLDPQRRRGSPTTSDSDDQRRPSRSIPPNQGVAPHPDTAALFHLRSSLTTPPTPHNLFTHLTHKRANTLSPLQHLSPSLSLHPTTLDRLHSSTFLPDWQRSLTHFDSAAFCCAFSKDGLTYMVATQDHTVHLYHTHSTSSHPHPFKQIRARRVGYSIIDIDYSPDSRFICYSAWSPYVQLCNVHGEYELHEALDMQPHAGRQGRVCFFSVRFSPDGRMVLGGTNENRLYLFDVERKERVLSVHGHGDDINTVAYADQSGNLLVTGSDDRTIRLWDRRTLSSPDSPGAEERGQHHAAVASFCGHEQGITHVESAGDGRLFCSNGKDQTIRLWDIRRATTAQQAADVGRETNDYDYRWESPPNSASSSIPDCSIATYRGHQVFRTLIRCHFSPARTGCRYIYTGSYAGEGQPGEVVVYDVMTGEVVRRLRGHRGIVRDVSWHPSEPTLISASWDQSLGRWEFGEEAEGEEGEGREDMAVREDGDEGEGGGGDEDDQAGGDEADEKTAHQGERPATYSGYQRMQLR